MTPNIRWADRHPTLADIRKGVVVAVVLAILAGIAHKVLPDSAQDAAWAWVSGKQSSPRGIFWLLALAAVAWVAYGVWRLIRRYIERPPPCEAYRSDEFSGLRWRWKWQRGGVIEPRAYCPKCDLQLDGMIVTAGPSQTPTGRVAYTCHQCHEQYSVLAANSLDAARAAALQAERAARQLGLLTEY